MILADFFSVEFSSLSWPQFFHSLVFFYQISSKPLRIYSPFTYVVISQTSSKELVFFSSKIRIIKVSIENENVPQN